MKAMVELRTQLCGDTVDVVSISPILEDHVSLRRLLALPKWSPYTGMKWVIRTVATLESALQILDDSRPSIVLSERDLSSGTWKDVLEKLSALPDPPLLIVTSRLADEYLWAEALNLGAYDVLTKPFDSEEVIRVLSSAWLHKNRWRATAGQTRSLEAAAAG